MKVLHLTTNLNIGGITTYLSLLSKGLCASGTRSEIASAGGEMADTFLKSDIELHAIPIQTKNALSPKVGLSFWALKKLFRKNKWDLIHAHTRVTQCLGYLLSKTLHIPYVTTFHGYYRHHQGRKLWPCLGNRTIAISEGVASDLKTAYAPQLNHIKTILHGIDTDHFSPEIVSDEAMQALKKRYGIQNRPTIGLVSRLSLEKGHQNLLDIFQFLKEHSNPNIQLIIVGDGKQKEAISKKCAELGLHNSVILIPSQPDPRIIYSLMDVYMIHHHGPEGFGLSTLEAMAMEKPVIISYKKGLNIAIVPFLKNGTNGYIFNSEYSVTEKAKQIESLINNKNRQQHMGKANRALVKQLFSYERMSRETQILYESTIH